MDTPNFSVTQRPLTSSALAKAIFKADLPEQFIRTIPAQSLHMVIRLNGLGSSSDLIEMTTVEQCRLLIDFDCWSKWYFSEDALWEWLMLSGEQDDLALLQKILKSIDLKLLAILIQRHTEVENFEQGTDLPPGPGYYTPDKGRTWVNIKLEDDTKHLLLGRLLAMVFETNTDLFYRLLALRTTTTTSTLEEEAFQDRSKRLSSEGIPDTELSQQINAPLSEAEARLALTARKTHSVVEDILAVHPLIYDSGLCEPLNSLLKQVTAVEDVESELTHILNAGIIHWSVDFSQVEAVEQLARQVKGAINIGLETAASLGGNDLLVIFQTLGIAKLYRLGLTKLFELRRQAAALRKRIPGEVEQTIITILDAASAPFPRMPAFFDLGAFVTSEDGSLLTGEKPFEHLKELSAIKGFLERQGSGESVKLQ